MNIIRSLGRGLLLGTVTVCMSLWIMVMTLQSTLLNRDVVKGWISNSGAYSHVLGSVMSLQSLGQGEETLDQEALQTAISETLTPAYIKEVTETGLDSIYDWLEGKTESISFSIPVSEKRNELQQKFQAALEPALKDLPVCTSGYSGLSSEEIKCLPQGADFKTAAENAAKQTVEGSEFLTAPITEDVLDQSGLQYMGWLPPMVQNAGMASMVLPIVAALCGLAYVFLGDRKLASMRTLAGHLLFGTVLGTIAGAGLWYLGGNVKLEQAVEGAGNVALIQDVIQPLIYQVVPSIGFWLMTFAGSVALVSGITWVTLLILSKRMPKHSNEHTELDSQVSPDNKIESLDVPVSPVQKVPEPEHVVEPAEPKPPTKTIGRM